MASLTIQTSRLKIRPLCLADLADFHVYRSNPEVTKYQGFEVMNLEEAEAFIQSNPKGGEEKVGDWVQYGIEKNSTGQLIGDCVHLNLESSIPESQKLELPFLIWSKKKASPRRHFWVCWLSFLTSKAYIE